MLRYSEAGWSNPKVIATLLLIFVCGGVIGVAATRTYFQARLTRAAGSAATIEKARHLGLGSLKAELNLTSNQEQVIMKTLDDYGKFYQNIEDEREDTARMGTRQILGVLTPEQQRRFHELIQGSAR